MINYENELLQDLILPNITFGCNSGRAGRS